MQFLSKRASFRLCLHDEKEKWSQSSGRKLWNVPRSRFWNLNKSRLLNSMVNDGLRPSTFTVNKPSMKPPASANLTLVRLAMYSATEIYLSLHKESTFGTKQNKAPAVWSIHYETSGRSQSWSYTLAYGSQTQVLEFQVFSGSNKPLLFAQTCQKLGLPSRSSKLTQEACPSNYKKYTTRSQRCRWGTQTHQL